MPVWKTVAIVGAGLIGASLGMALRERRLAERVVGIGRRPASLAEAKARGAVDEIFTDLAAGVRDAELIIICTPVASIARQAAEIAGACPRGATITDAGSTKSGIVAEIGSLSGRLGREVHFVGSHPLAGSEKTGPAAARADLFHTRVAIITPIESSHPQAVAVVERMWSEVGARVMRMTPEEHDRVLGATSHLPHLVAAALAAATPPEILGLTGAGWLDTTRIAAGDPELWHQIYLANRGHSLQALADFERVLSRWRAALEAGDGPLLLALLQEGKQIRDAVGS
jgi:prephenate dehydrogenase